MQRNVWNNIPKATLMVKKQYVVMMPSSHKYKNHRSSTAV